MLGGLHPPGVLAQPADQAGGAGGLCRCSSASSGGWTPPLQRRGAAGPARPGVQEPWLGRRLAFEQALVRAYDAAATGCWRACSPHRGRPCCRRRRRLAPPASWRRVRPAAGPIPTNAMSRRYSRITGTGSYLPPRRCHQRRSGGRAGRRVASRPATTGSSSAPASARATSPPPTCNSQRPGRARRPPRWQPRAASRRHRPDHRGHVHAGHGVPVHRLHPAAQAGHGGLPGVRRAGGVQRLRLRPHGGRRDDRPARPAGRW
jgi:hypothetical protein